MIAIFGVLVRATEHPEESDVEYGIWTDGDGGFTEIGLHSLGAAEIRLAEIIAESPDPDADREDLSIKEVCPDHEDQPKDDCDECYAEDDDNEGE